MTASRYPTAWCVVLVSLLLTGCGGVIDPSKNQVEEFSGTLQVGAANLHHFNASKNGEVDIRITQLAPNPDVALGLQSGRELNGQCSPDLVNFFAQINRIGLAGFVNSGRQCLIVSDVGFLNQPATYTIRVSHP